MENVLGDDDELRPAAVVRGRVGVHQEAVHLIAGGVRATSAPTCSMTPRSRGRGRRDSSSTHPARARRRRCRYRPGSTRRRLHADEHLVRGPVGGAGRRHGRRLPSAGGVCSRPTRTAARSTPGNRRALSTRRSGLYHGLSRVPRHLAPAAHDRSARRPQGRRRRPGLRSKVRSLGLRRVARERCRAPSSGCVIWRRRARRHLGRAAAARPAHHAAVTAAARRADGATTLRPPALAGDAAPTEHQHRPRPPGRARLWVKPSSLRPGYGAAGAR